jgi:hypothetical protein
MENSSSVTSFQHLCPFELQISRNLVSKCKLDYWVCPFRNFSLLKCAPLERVAGCIFCRQRTKQLSSSGPRGLSGSGDGRKQLQNPALANGLALYSQCTMRKVSKGCGIWGLIQLNMTPLLKGLTHTFSDLSCLR